MKSVNDFEKYYQDEYKNIVSGYYEKFRNACMPNVIIRLLLGVFLTLILNYLLGLLNIDSVLLKYFSAVKLTLTILLICGTIMITYRYYRKEISKINENVIRDMLAFISSNKLENVMYEPNKRISEEALREMELFNLDVVNCGGHNYCKVPYNKNTMVFSDMNTHIYNEITEKKVIYKAGKRYIRTTKKKKKKIIFEGLYVGATLNKQNQNYIYLIPNKFNDTFLQKEIMSYIKYTGVPVMLENLEFSKKYKVFCDDEIQARYILSLGLMEKINELDNLFKGKKYIVFKEGKRFAICIEGLNIEKIRNIKLPAFSRRNELKVLTAIFEKLSDLFKIYHVLDLGNDLYVKNV